MDHGPWTKYIQAKRGEWRFGGERISRKAGHLLCLGRTAKSPTGDTLVDDAVHTPFTINYPKTGCTDGSLCEKASLVLDPFVVMPHQ